MSFYFPTHEEVEDYRKRFPVGSTIVCDFCADMYHPIDPGTKGVINHIDDMKTVHVTWENGRTLGLVPSEDAFHLL